MSQTPLFSVTQRFIIITHNLKTMSRCMGPTKAKLVVISLIWAILVSEVATVSSAGEDHHNKKECEDGCNGKMITKIEKETSREEEEEQDPFCKAFCKSFEGLYQHCMTVCPRTKSKPEMMAIGGDGVANGDLQTNCNRKCTSYTEPEVHKRCMSGCFRSMRIDNEAVCETTCSILQEEPLAIRCMRVCHERIPGAIDSSRV